MSNGLKWISSTWIKFLIILLREEGNNLFEKRSNGHDRSLNEFGNLSFHEKEEINGKFLLGQMNVHARVLEGIIHFLRNKQRKRRRIYIDSREVQYAIDVE